MQVAENDPLCRRLSLTELMPIAWQRLTKYKLLINNILKSYKKDWDNLDGKTNIKIMLNITYILSYTLSCTHAEEDKKEGTQIETAHTCVKVHCVDQRSRGESVYDILFFLLHKQVKRAENKQRLADLQAKMDYSAMEKAQHPIAQLFKV